MLTAIGVGVVGIFVTVVIQALTLAHRLGKLEQKIDVVHDWFMSRIDVRIGGRRHTDVAADDGEG